MKGPEKRAASAYDRRYRHRLNKPGPGAIMPKWTGLLDYFIL